MRKASTRIRSLALSVIILTIALTSMVMMPMATAMWSESLHVSGEILMAGRTNTPPPPRPTVTEIPFTPVSPTQPAFFTLTPTEEPAVKEITPTPVSTMEVIQTPIIIIPATETPGPTLEIEPTSTKIAPIKPLPTIELPATRPPVMITETPETTPPPSDDGLGGTDDSSGTTPLQTPTSPPLPTP